MAIDDKNLSHFGVFRKAAHKLYVEYLERSVTHGLRMIRRTEGDSYGRYIWLGFLVFIFVLTHMNVYNLAIEFSQAPTETRLSPKLVPVKNVLFPAIALCSNNQFSKKALMEYSQKLFEFQEKYHPRLVAKTATELADKLLVFGGFLLHPFDAHLIDDRQLQNLNDLLSYRYGNSSYPTRTILRGLGPKCEDLIMRCVIGNENKNCSELFFMRSTTSGICCLFNYRRISYNTDNKELFERDMNASAQSRRNHFKTAGARASIQVVIQDDTDDYTLKEYPCDGFRAFLFYQDDYADTETGSVTKALVGYNEEYEVFIQPEIMEGSQRMRQFSSKMRHCYFREEGQEILKQDYYSFSECILDCRVRSLINHCGCTAPVLPMFVNNVPYCVLLDLPCIELWKSIWWQWNSFDYVSEKKFPKSTLELCEQCLPLCNVMTYKIYVNSRPLNIPKNVANFSIGILKGLSTSKPTAVIKFIYKSTFSQVKTHDISADWVELLARYGGICSIMYGFSIVAVIELIYFATGKWFALWWKCLVECIRNCLKRRSEAKVHQELYWNELKPKGTFPSREINNL